MGVTGTRLKGRPDQLDKERERYLKYRATLVDYMTKLDAWAASGFDACSYEPLHRSKLRVTQHRSALYNFVKPAALVRHAFKVEHVRGDNGRHSTLAIFEGFQKPI